MVGDTTHDVEVARAMGIDAVTIARGHSARAALEKRARRIRQCGRNAEIL